MQGAESYQETSIMDEFSTSGMSEINDNNSLLLNLNSSHENLTAMEPKLALFVCLITTSISLVTTAGNILVIIAFYMNKRLQTITNYFILSLAYADMVIGLVSMNLFTIYIVQGEWNLGPLVCDIWLCIDYVACNASVMNLLIISVDRYLALTKPMTYRVKRTKRRACLMIVGAWTVSFILWVPSILLWPLVEGGRNVQNKKCYIRFILASPAVAIGTAMAAFYVPVLVMSILSWYINRVNVEHRKYANTFRIRKSTNEKNIGQYSVNKTLNGTRSSAMSDRIKERNTQGVKVWKMRRNQNNTLEEDEHNKENGSKIQPPLAVIKVETSSFDHLGQEPHKDEITIEKSKSSFRLSETTASLLNATRQNVRNMSARENKAARMLLCIMVVFIITWAPYNILVVISTVCGEDGCVNDILWKLSYWLCYLNSTINPACYAMCSPEFRRTFHRLLRCQRSNDLFRTKTSLKPFARAAALSVGENLTTVQ
uniref:muscarinic acetylcholine receptor M2-like isoform X2 n=2 Tax=Ciona intestinalis TaxID=7719 RepID=UPI0002B8D376|nr:muscarinic acetylcholine receptor M2-like isoform X2 [Ciona intestinalis]|eukprot:XP_002121904.4 muscarinic acetylcholine receptor M2-like isoform X2 [Ciona intestinalis]